MTESLQAESMVKAMEYMQGVTGLYVRDETAVTLGKFDGLHRGHQKLIRRILQAEKGGLASVVFTLDPGRSGGILVKDERRQMLADQGISYLIDCPMEPELLHMSPEDFVAQVLVDRLHAKYIVVGSDFRFGYQRSGDYRLLMELQKLYDFRVEVVRKEQHCGRDISSSFIREELEKGNMEMVNQLLGYSFFISGEVLHGRQIGRTLGMPTTNLVPSTRKLLPPNGVYVSQTILDGKAFPGITNIGYKPTIGESFKGVETHIFDYDGDLYGKDIQVRLLSFKRPERKFQSREALKHQVEDDIAYGRAYFSGR
ncbi:MAG: bifunctional riboflavin kinase/FAD synthetase [Candidatus Limivivens sp.]|nr:bifunctional riboflavin kinase/FAD synthetase [Candidatus Limivivens sp.]